MAYHVPYFPPWYTLGQNSIFCPLKILKMQKFKLVISSFLAQNTDNQIWPLFMKIKFWDKNKNFSPVCSALDQK